MLDEILKDPQAFLRQVSTHFTFTQNKQVLIKLFQVCLLTCGNTPFYAVFINSIGCIHPIQLEK